jgi:hypothetical protein
MASHTHTQCGNTQQIQSFNCAQPFHHPCLHCRRHNHNHDGNDDDADDDNNNHHHHRHRLLLLLCSIKNYWTLL